MTDEVPEERTDSVEECGTQSPIVVTSGGQVISGLRKIKAINESDDDVVDVKLRVVDPEEWDEREKILGEESWEEFKEGVTKKVNKSIDEDFPDDAGRLS